MELVCVYVKMTFPQKNFKFKKQNFLWKITDRKEIKVNDVFVVVNGCAISLYLCAIHIYSDNVLGLPLSQIVF